MWIKRHKKPARGFVGWCSLQTCALQLLIHLGIPKQRVQDPVLTAAERSSVYRNERKQMCIQHLYNHITSFPDFAYGL